MRTFVCVKGVPNLAGAEVKLAEGGRAIDLAGLTLELNDADSCAVEAGILLKEAVGGWVRTVTLGGKEQEVVIRMALARGCDAALRVEGPELGAGAGPRVIARILAAAIRGQEFDLVLTGAMAADDGHMAVGVALAEELGVPHAAMAKKISVKDGKATVVRELEGGVGEVVEVKLPAVLTIQTGINKPRYAQILGIRAAQKKEIKPLTLADVGLDAQAPAEPDRGVALVRFYKPTIVPKAEFLQGDLDAQTEYLAAKVIRAGGF